MEIVKMHVKAEDILDDFFKGEGEKEILIKSKDRVAANGEVFTPRETVKNMMDLEGVDEESFKLESTFLEPACGNGNFLVQIIARKLMAVDIAQMDLDVIRAVCSVYGVDITPDNINESRDRMMRIIEIFYNIEGAELTALQQKNIRYVLNRNIICGDTLRAKKIDEYNIDKRVGDKRVYGETPFQISEWRFNGTEVTRIEHPFNALEDSTFDVEYLPVDFNKLWSIKDKTFDADMCMI